MDLQFIGLWFLDNFGYLRFCFDLEVLGLGLYVVLDLVLEFRGSFRGEKFQGKGFFF